MGIPRFTQDIAPYAQHADLGAAANDSNGITRVIVDGPSLVYHVYYLVFKSYHSESSLDSSNDSEKQLWPHPPYSLINDAVVEFLQDLRVAGLNVIRIFFDGALPVAKESIRRQRVEQNRKQLDSYRHAHHLRPPSGVFNCTQEHADLRSILWKTRASVLSSTHIPPAPFLIPSAVERLFSDKEWSDAVELVPGESDPYCAAAAASHGAAILSNDSDMILHELGHSASVLTLNGLILDDRGGKVPVLNGTFLKPQIVAEGLGVEQLKKFGFQRYLDGQATTKIIAERAHFMLTMDTVDISWKQFSDEYATARLVADGRQVPPFTLSGSDPRIAEIICMSVFNRPVQIFLPILLEDPSRDSAWSYGSDIRQIGYTILLSSFLDQGRPTEVRNVVEYLRKGRVMRDCSLQCITQPELARRMDEFVSVHQAFVDVSQSPLLGYYSLAAHVVESRKRGEAKSCLFQLSALFRSELDSASQFSWDDVHILACMHAVLYSIRVLKQLLEYSLKHLALDISVKVKASLVLDALSTLPAIEALILSPGELEQELRNFPITMRDHALARVRDYRSDKEHTMSHSSDSSTDTRMNSTTDIDHSSLLKTITEPKRKKRRSNSQPKDRTSLILKTQQGARGQISSQNRFAAFEDG